VALQRRKPPIPSLESRSRHDGAGRRASRSYHLAFLGGRVKGAVCQIGVRADRVELGFIHGVLLPDPGHLLRGTGKSKRIVRVDHVGQYPARVLARLVRDAVEIRPDGFVTPERDAGVQPARAGPGSNEFPGR